MWALYRVSPNFFGIQRFMKYNDRVLNCGIVVINNVGPTTRSLLLVCGVNLVYLVKQSLLQKYLNISIFTWEKRNGLPFLQRSKKLHFVNILKFACY